MFILRSAFWLTLAFIVMSPKPVDLGATAGDLSGRAMAAGQQLIARQILASACTTADCLGGQALAAAALGSALPAGGAAPVAPAGTVPFPRPRPDWLG